MNMPLTAPLVGQGLRRVDARAKVTDRADYAGDRLPFGAAHAALVTAAFAKGRITRLETAAARRRRALLVATHEDRRAAIHRVGLEMELDLRPSGARGHAAAPEAQGPLCRAGGWHGGGEDAEGGGTCREPCRSGL